MKRIINNIISVIYTTFRFLIIKVLHRENFSYNIIERFSPNVEIELEKGARLSLGKKVRAHSGCKFKIRKGAHLIIEDEVSFNYNCMIFCHDKIVIKKGVEFGPNILIYDHDHDYKSKGGIKDKKFTTSAVEIGENTWIGANVIILQGSKIGQNCVVAAGSVVKDNIDNNTVYIQQRKNIKKILYKGKRK